MPLKGYKASKEHREKVSMALKGKMPKNINFLHDLPEDIEKKRILSISKAHKDKKKPWLKGNKHTLGRIMGEVERLKRGYSKERKKYKDYVHKKDSLYRQWRSKVFERDNWTCQTCWRKSSVGDSVYLEPHHIKGWAKFPELRYEVFNGITLCKDCHKEVHKKSRREYLTKK